MERKPLERAKVAQEEPRAGRPWLAGGGLKIQLLVARVTPLQRVDHPEKTLQRPPSPQQAPLTEKKPSEWITSARAKLALEKSRASESWLAGDGWRSHFRTLGGSLLREE